MKIRCNYISLSILMATQILSAEGREWQLSDGTTMKGGLVGISEESVHIRISRDAVKKIEKNKLSASDKNFVAEFETPAGKRALNILSKTAAQLSASLLPKQRVLKMNEKGIAAEEKKEIPVPVSFGGQKEEEKVQFRAVQTGEGELNITEGSFPVYAIGRERQGGSHTAYDKGLPETETKSWYDSTTGKPVDGTRGYSCEETRIVGKMSLSSWKNDTRQLSCRSRTTSVMRLNAQGRFSGASLEWIDGSFLFQAQYDETGTLCSKEGKPALVCINQQDVKKSVAYDADGRIDPVNTKKIQQSEKKKY